MNKLVQEKGRFKNTVSSYKDFRIYNLSEFGKMQQF